MSWRIGKRLIGEGKCFVIAEAGSNHNGSLRTALDLIDVASEAGADAVKFQLFRAAKLYPKSAGPSAYLRSRESIYEIIERMETPYEWLPKLADHCQRAGVEFLCSGFDENSVDRLDPFVEAHKVASYEMTHVPLLRHVARKGKPLLLSTGTSNMDEVALAVDLVRSENPRLVLMQCTAAYPAPMESLNLLAMQFMRDKLSVFVGLSDHSRDPVVAPLGAVALGGVVVEKHFTLSNTLSGPDHKFAIEPTELKLMVTKIRELEQAMGSGTKRVHPVEEELRAFARRSIFATREIEAGERLTPDNIAVLRCGNRKPALDPARYDDLLHRRVVRTVAAETAITMDDCE